MPFSTHAAYKGPLADTSVYRCRSLRLLRQTEPAGERLAVPLRSARTSTSPHRRPPLSALLWLPTYRGARERRGARWPLAVVPSRTRISPWGWPARRRRRRRGSATDAISTTLAPVAHMAAHTSRSRSHAQRTPRRWRARRRTTHVGRGPRALLVLWLRCSVLTVPVNAEMQPVCR
jgi:hypothetical protein